MYVLQHRGSWLQFLLFRIIKGCVCFVSINGMKLAESFMTVTGLLPGVKRAAN